MLTLETAKKNNYSEKLFFYEVRCTNFTCNIGSLLSETVHGGGGYLSILEEPIKKFRCSFIYLFFSCFLCIFVSLYIAF